METVSAVLALFAGNSPLTGEISSQRPVTRSFDVFFDLRLNKRLSKQSWGWWFETPSRQLWRHCNENVGERSPLFSRSETVYMYMRPIKVNLPTHACLMIHGSIFTSSIICRQSDGSSSYDPPSLKTKTSWPSTSNTARVIFSHGFAT